MSLTNAILVIQQGDPYPVDSEIGIASVESVIGRAWKDHIPDLAFTNPLISRKHALIRLEHGTYVIADLSSKHGTSLNGRDLPPNQFFPLKHGSLISLAKGAVNLLFKEMLDEEIDTTIDLDRYMASLPTNQKPLNISLERREVLIEGKPLNLSGKDLDLLLYLYANCNRAVSYNQIKSAVWSERPSSSDDNIPDVGSDEITALIYRLRKRMGSYGSSIITIPRYGYRLDCD